MSTIVLALLLIAFVGAFVFTGKAIYHMYYVVTNITGKYGNFLGPFVLLMPSQFTPEGNKHRVALAPAIFGVIVCWAVILFARGYLDH
jgi:hypothetical protein